MTTIRPIYRLFRSGIIILLILTVLIEAVSWSNDSEIKLEFIRRNGGFWPYLGLLIRSLLLPETMTVFILAILIYTTRQGLQIRLVDLTRNAIIRYQLSFLPILLVAFLVFIPFTQTVRYLLVEFPHYSFASYWSKYIIGSYTWLIYFRYLFFELILGYSLLNLSLITSSPTSRSLVIEQSILKNGKRLGF